MYDRYLNFIYKYRFYIIGLVLSITILGLVIISKITIDNSLGIWFTKNDKVWNDYWQFRKTFEDDEIFFVIYKNDSLFTKTQLDLNRSLTKDIEKLNYVEKAISITNVTIPQVVGTSIRYRNLIPESINDSTDYKKRVISKKIIVNNLISSDGKATGIAITLNTQSNDLRKIFTNDVNNLIHSEKYIGNKYYLAGNIVASNEMYRLSLEESGKYFSISLIVMFVLVGFLFRNFRLSLLVHINSLIIIIWTLALFTIFNNSINLITGLIPIVLLVVSYTISIHITSHYQKEFIKVGDKIMAMRTAFKNSYYPCFFAILTTAISFLSFTFTKIHPIYSFGVYVFIGLWLIQLLSTVFLPAILFINKPTAFTDKKEPQLRLIPFTRVVELVSKRFKLIALISLIIFLISIVGITQLTFQSDQVRYFSKKNYVRQTNELAQKWFNAIYNIEVIFTLPDSLLDRTFQNYKLMDTLENQIAKIDGVLAIHSPVIFIKDFFPSEPIRNIALLSIQSNKKHALTDNNYKFFKYISDDGHTSRMTIRTQWMNAEDAQNLINSMDKVIKEQLRSKGIEYKFTGIMQIIVYLNKLLTYSQIINITVSFILIFFVFLFLYRSLKWAITAMLPNIFPVVLTLGVMGWCGVSMDIATVMIAAISLGISVDDTIHLINAFRNYGPTDKTFIEKYSDIINKIGSPITFTSLILITGLSVLIFSDFQPIAYMGLFLSLNILFAYLADIILTPSLMQLFNIQINPKIKEVNLN